MATTFEMTVVEREKFYITDGENILIGDITLSEAEGLRDLLIDTISNLYAEELGLGDYICEGCNI